MSTVLRKGNNLFSVTPKKTGRSLLVYTTHKFLPFQLDPQFAALQA
jgi:hypothetical protein